MFGTISRACGDGEGEPQLKGRRKVRVRQKLKKEYMGGVMAVGVWDKQTKSKWREFRGHTRSVKCVELMTGTDTQFATGARGTTRSWSGTPGTGVTPYRTMPSGGLTAWFRG